MRATSGRCGWWAVLVLLAVVGGARTGYAQGFYYKEIRKDDRIYVFNLADEADRFEKTGEMGRGLTRPGAGPNGETVVADSERALQLFFFKHNISEPVPEPPVPLQRIAWSDGKTRITTDFAYLEISNRVQVRYTQEMPDDTITLPGTGGPGDTKGSFRIRRAKFKLEGWFWIPPQVAPSPAVLPKLSVRAATQLGGRWRQRWCAARQRRCNSRRRKYRVGSAGEGQVSIRVGTVQGAVRTSTDDLFRESAVCRSSAGVR